VSDSETYPIPDADLTEFHRLPIEHQREIRAKLRIFWAVDHAARRERKAVWADKVAQQNALFDARGDRTRLTVKTLYGARALFHNAHRDWIVLVDLRKVPDWDAKERRRMESLRPTALNPEFVRWVQGLTQGNARSGEQAISEVYRRWRCGEHVPGYGAWTDWYRREFPQRPVPPLAPMPEGWSRRHLRRCFPKAAHLAIARRGVAAGLAELPSIIRTREGLRPLEYVVLDDWRSDFLVYVPGVEAPVEMHGILAEDVACAIALRFGLRPALPRPDGSDEGLKRVDTRSLAADILLKYGYPLDYVSHWIVENGTATITRDDAAAIEELTHGHVKIHWTSMISGNVFGFPDRPVGNFRGKSWLESFISLVHNAAANIQGQIGAHYDVRPKSIPARAAELKALVKAQEALPAQLRDSITYRMPLPEARLALQMMNFVFSFLNHREHHALEAFEQQLKWRPDEHSPWRPVQELIDRGLSRDAIMAFAPRPIIETPMERWQRLSRDVRFGKVPMSAMPQLLAQHRLVTIEREGEVNIGSKSKPELYRDRHNPYLTVGRKYLAYVSEHNREYVHLTDGKQRYVCSVAKADRLLMSDSEGLSREIAAKTSQLKATLKRVRDLDLHAPQRLADVEANLLAAEKQLQAQDLLAAPAIAVPDDEGGVAACLAGAESAIGAARGGRPRVREREFAGTLARMAARLQGEAEE